MSGFGPCLRGRGTAGIHWYDATSHHRASGGIGRRAGFRCLCPQGRGGSSPPSPTEGQPMFRPPRGSSLLFSAARLSEASNAQSATVVAASGKRETRSLHARSPAFHFAYPPRPRQLRGGDLDGTEAWDLDRRFLPLLPGGGRGGPSPSPTAEASRGINQSQSDPD